jgi:hypothetical protein
VICRIDLDIVSISAGSIMSIYAQMMKKKGAMTKKGNKEAHLQNLELELLTDHGVQYPRVPQGLATVTAGAAATSGAHPDTQVIKKRKLVLQTRQASPAPASQGLETVHPTPQYEISILDDDEEAKTIGLALKLKRG